MNQEYRDQLATLAQTLGAERELLEFLLYRLTLARLVLAADEARFVPQAMREVEAVVERIRFSEAQRSVVVRRLAQTLGVDPSGLSMRHLVEIAPEPYRTMLDHHRNHFLRLTTEIEQVTLENRRLASIAVQNLTDTLGTLLGRPQNATYDAMGHAVGAGTARAERFDGLV